MSLTVPSILGESCPPTSPSQTLFYRRLRPFLARLPDMTSGLSLYEFLWAAFSQDIMSGPSVPVLPFQHSPHSQAAAREAE